MLEDVLQQSSSTQVKVKVIATEKILAYKVATYTGVNANSSNTAHRDKIAGIASVEIDNGFSGYAVAEGEIQNASWSWTKGDIIFLNGTNLSITPPTSGFRVIIGYASAANKIYVDISESILL